MPKRKTQEPQVKSSSKDDSNPATTPAQNATVINEAPAPVEAPKPAEVTLPKANIPPRKIVMPNGTIREDF